MQELQPERSADSSFAIALAAAAAKGWQCVWWLV